MLLCFPFLFLFLSFSLLRSFAGLTFASRCTRRANAAEERRSSAESRRAELESALLELTGRLDTWKERCEEQEQELKVLKDSIGTDSSEFSTTALYI